MTKSIRTILIPFLMISYVFGLRTVNLSNHKSLWSIVSAIYILLLWMAYYFLSTSPLISSIYEFYPVEDSICSWIDICTTLWSIVFGIYHNKKFQNCLKKFDVIDNTLLKLGTITDYNKLRKKAVYFILGWIVIVIFTTYYSTLLLKDEYDGDIAVAMLYIFIRNYTFYINVIGDLTTANIVGFIGLKFDEVNEHLQDLMKNKKPKIKRAWENSTIHPYYQSRFSKSLNNKWIMWIIIHLHLELRKISCEIDSIFGTQMTIKMVAYLGWVAVDLRNIFYSILINNYAKSKITSIILHLVWFFYNYCNVLHINYMCETVTAKANATADLLNRLSYSVCDIEIRKMISQFLLRIVYAPLRFCGLGFFQFGFKFLYRITMFIATVSVILIQAYKNT